jgi:hypothetical protein
VAQYEKEARLKDGELRSLVGDSYRDVLASADAIGSIAAQCQKVREILEGVVGLVSQGVEVGRMGSEEENVVSSSPRPSKANGLYALALDVKTIVDSQEAIYSYIDDKQFLSAAVRYLEAVALYRKTAPVVKSREVFPFLGHVWPGIKGLDLDIYEKAKGSVVHSCGLGSGEAELVADALATCGVLRPVEGVDLLGYYLDGRRKWILGGGLEMGAGDGEVSVSDRVVGRLAAMWETVGVALEVFGEGQDIDVDVGDARANLGSMNTSMLIKTVQARQISKPSYESSLRVSHSLLQLENETWLKQVAEDVRHDVLVPLLETVKGCGALREHVRQIEEAERGGQMFGELTWMELSRIATGQVVSLWDMMGREAVVARGKEILRARFDVSIDARFGGEEVDVEAYEAFDAALGLAVVEATECVGMDGPVFEDVVATEFGGLIDRTMEALEVLVNRTNDARDELSSCQLLGVIRFTSALQTQSDAYRRLLYVQYLDAGSDALKEASSPVMLPWARETSQRVGAVRMAATRAWAAARAALILNDVKEVREVKEVKVQNVASSGSTLDVTRTPESTPMYPSEWLTRALTQFCASLEETIASQEDLTRQSMETFKGALVKTLRALYTDNGVSIAKSRTLQRIYDSTFVNVLFWEEKGGAEDLITKELLQDLVATIDPVEWEEHRAAIDNNVERYMHHVAGYLRTRTDLVAPSKTTDTNAVDTGNMELAICNERFAYLPAKLPSKTPRPPSTSRSGPGSGLKAEGMDIPVPRLAQEPEFSIAGLQGLAKAKAAEVSDLLGSFL